MMKLYMNPASVTCRSILLFAADEGIELDYQVIDLMSGEHHKEDFSKLNPNHLVPVLTDGGFHLTESAAILGYMAKKTESKYYPKDIKAQAKVDELINWFSTQLYRELGYHVVYPQIFDHHKRTPGSVNEVNAKWGVDKTKASLQILNDYFLNDESTYLVNNEKTIADYFGAGILSSGELVGFKLDNYPNVKRWFENMKSTTAWNKVCEAHIGFCNQLKEKTFITVD